MGSQIHSGVCSNVFKFPVGYSIGTDTEDYLHNWCCIGSAVKHGNLLVFEHLKVFGSSYAIVRSCNVSPYAMGGQIELAVFEAPVSSYDEAEHDYSHFEEGDYFADLQHLPDIESLERIVGRNAVASFVSDFRFDIGLIRDELPISMVY